MELLPLRVVFPLPQLVKKGLSEKLNLKSEDLFGYAEGGYENDSCTVNGNEVSFQADLKYPGANRVFTIKITNTGTIDAYYNTETGLELLKDKFCMDKSNDGIIDESECDNRDYSVLIGGKGDEVIAFEKSDGTIVDFINTDGATDFMDEHGNIIIKPGESMYLYTMALIDESLEGNSIFATEETSIKLNFTQAVAK